MTLTPITAKRTANPFNLTRPSNIAIHYFRPLSYAPTELCVLCGSGQDASNYVVVGESKVVR